MRRAAPVVVFALLASACASVKPIPISAGDVCFHCRRTITDTSIAAEMVSSQGHAFKFSSPVCLAEYLRDHPSEPVKSIFVTDHARLKLMEAQDAYYVPFTTPPPYTATEFAAFRDEDAAMAFAELHQAKPTNWAGVMAANVTHVGH